GEGHAKTRGVPAPHRRAVRRGARFPVSGRIDTIETAERGPVRSRLMDNVARLCRRRALATLTAVALGVMLAAAGPVALPSPAPAQPGKPGEIEHLVEQLGSLKFRDREEASKRLEALGEPAWAALRKAAVSPDSEVRRRAQRLLQSIAKRAFVEV